MSSSDIRDVIVTGLGVVSAIGQGKEVFLAALLDGHQRFDYLRRPGRQLPGSQGAQPARFLGAEIAEMAIPSTIPAHLLRNASLSAKAALTVLAEAWDDAALGDVDRNKIGLIVGGSNFQQRELLNVQQQYREKAHFLRPTYGLTYMDGDLCGLCTEAFDIRGFAFTLGGASASGQAAVIQAAQAIQAGQVDVCIVIGALTDLSFWEFQGLKSLGAMGSDRYMETPALACRPFDRDCDGFIYGEACGAVVLQRDSALNKNTQKRYARLCGWSVNMDANRNPNPSLAGELKAITGALKHAGLTPDQVDYINPHGTGSSTGDEIELNAIRQSGLVHCKINATKSMTGHGLCAAGSIEIVATLLQMESGMLHPTRNLDNPIDPRLNWIGSVPERQQFRTAMSLSMGFGGINTAACFQRD